MKADPDIRNRLRNDIIAGSLPFGARLRILELADRYGVSHMPVREALHELRGEGLVVIERNRGARVRPISLSFVEDLFDTRNAIETMLARRACERRTKAQLAELVATEEELEAFVATGDYASVPAVNRRFHAIINEAAGNPGALSLVDRHWLLMAALGQRYQADTSRFHGVIEDHRHIVKAINRGDAASASTLMGAHIEKAKHGLIEQMAADAQIAESASEEKG